MNERFYVFAHDSKEVVMVTERPQYQPMQTVVQAKRRGRAWMVRIVSVVIHTKLFRPVTDWITIHDGKSESRLNLKQTACHVAWYAREEDLKWTKSACYE